MKTILNLFDNTFSKLLRYSTREIGFITFTHQKDIGFDDNVFLSTYNINLQRDLCWTLEQKQKFIISLLEGKDVGKFTIYVNWDRDGIYEIIDGKQRINTIIEFIENKFSICAPDNNSYYFNNFTLTDKRFFNSIPINVAMIDNGGHDNLTDRQKVQLFLFINDTGVPIEQNYLTKLNNIIK